MSRMVLRQIMFASIAVDYGEGHVAEAVIWIELHARQCHPKGRMQPFGEMRLPPEASR